MPLLVRLGILLLASLLAACEGGDRPVRGLWTGHARVEGAPPTRVRLDGEARCLILRHRASELRVRIAGTAPAGTLTVSVADVDLGAPKPVTTVRLPLAGGAFRQELRLSRAELGGASWLSLGFDQPGLVLEALEPVEDAETPRLVVFALDGLSWRILEPLLKAGRLPHIRELLRRGVAGTLLSIKPTLSPVVWTTVATGREPRDHGIRDFFDEERHLVNSTQVKTKRLWEIASERSPATVGVVGWFVTWPVERVAGFMLSDRAKQWRTTQEERPLSFYPAELQACFEDVLAERRQRYLAECRRFTPLAIDAEWRERLAPEDPAYERLEALDTRFLRVYLRDSAFVEAGLRFYSAFAPDLFFVYLRGADNAQHAYWFQRAPQESLAPVAEEERRIYGGIIDGYYAYLDEAIGRFVAAAPADTRFAIVSDHGFRSFVRAKGGEQRSVAYHEREGVYVLSGPGYRRGARGEPISVLDLAPLWLYELGLPVARDMPGRVPLELRSGWLRRKPQQIASYGARAERAVSRTSEMDEDIVEQLKALGYVED